MASTTRYVSWAVCWQTVPPPALPASPWLLANAPARPNNLLAIAPTLCPPAHPAACLQAYVSGVNKALEQYAEAEHKGDVAAMIALQPAIKFNGGGAPLPLSLRFNQSCRCCRCHCRRC